PGSLAALFGRFQTADGGLRQATSLPLPTTLNGVSVTVNGTPAQLLMTSNGQANIVTPPGTAVGSALFMVTNSDGSVTGGRVNMTSPATGIFSINASGQGTAAAVWTTDGLTYNSVINPDGSERPIPVGSANSPTFLVLFATGLSNANLP